VKRAVSYGLMAAVIILALGVGTLDAGAARTPEERIEDIARTVRCPACRSQSSWDSQAPTAIAVRTEIGERIDEGQSDDEIRDYFASTYGDEILLTPPSTGVGSLVWIIPVVVVVAAGAGLFFAFRRWQVWE
jgi:cytochrome c-type biogenesis protein CcmH